MKSLFKKYDGQTINIVGSGSSIRYLNKDYFIDGPVVALNLAIVSVEKLDLLNPIYSMQKDKGRYVKTKNSRLGVSNPTCDRALGCGEICGPCPTKVRPKKATLLLDMNDSACCFPDYNPRILINQGGLGLKWDMASFFVALRLGGFFGCLKYRIISCDTIAGIDNVYQYRGQHRISKVFLPTINYEFITPTKKDGAK